MLVLNLRCRLSAIILLIILFRFIVVMPVLAQGPVLQNTHPEGNTNATPLNDTIRATYNQSIDSATVTSRTFAVHAAQTGWLTQTLSVNGGEITLNPLASFKPGELVRASATTGILNNSGLAPDRATVWQFVTAAGTGPGGFFDSGQSLGNGNSARVSLGDLDAFVLNWDEANKVWLNDGAGIFTDSGQNLGQNSSSALSLGDVDGDGDLDAVVANADQINKVWLNNEAGVFTDSGQNLGESFSLGLSMGDVNGDSTLDAFVVNLARANTVWENLPKYVYVPVILK